MKKGSLVAYSDSEDDEPGADSAPPAIRDQADAF